MSISARCILLTVSLVGLMCAFVVFLGYTHLIFCIVNCVWVKRLISVIALLHIA